jgi:hypothetical protein
MGAVKPPADRGDPHSWGGLDGRGGAVVGAAAKRFDSVQSQAHTRHAHPAPQVETAEAVACW